MRITFLLSAQWAALSLRMASVSSLLKPQAVNRPGFTMRNQTSFVSGKQSAVLFRVWPTMRFLCALRGTRAPAYAHEPPPLCRHVENNLALGNKYFWKTKWRQANKKILVHREAPHATSSVFSCSHLTGLLFLGFEDKFALEWLLCYCDESACVKRLVSLPAGEITQCCLILPLIGQ